MGVAHVCYDADPAVDHSITTSLWIMTSLCVRGASGNGTLFSPLAATEVRVTLTAYDWNQTQVRYIQV